MKVTSQPRYLLTVCRSKIFKVRGGASSRGLPIDSGETQRMDVKKYYISYPKEINSQNVCDLDRPYYVKLMSNSNIRVAWLIVEYLWDIYFPVEN